MSSGYIQFNYKKRHNTITIIPSFNLKLKRGKKKEKARREKHFFSL